jgi:phosphoribosylformimino-5-aminoimidazole carboxamide ribotide isomerase
MIIPSIDLMDGKAVQLKQGKEKVLEREDVFDLAEKFSKYEIAVIDLDSALNKNDNLEIIKKLCKNYNCRVGGGIRTVEKANEILGFGAKKIIIGTKASPEFLKQLPKDKIIVAIDTKDGFVVNKGWTEKTKETPEEVIRKLEDYCCEFLFTNVNKEGLMKGFDFGKVKKLVKLTKNKITVAGGITTIEDIKKLENIGCNSQIGMALYTGKINLEEAFQQII